MATTFEQVLELLHLTGPYRIHPPHGAGERFQFIRTAAGEDPLCALANVVEGKVRWRTDYGAAAAVLGLPDTVADRLASAADSTAHPDREALERALTFECDS